MSGFFSVCNYVVCERKIKQQKVCNEVLKESKYDLVNRSQQTTTFRLLTGHTADYIFTNAQNPSLNLPQRLPNSTARPANLHSLQGPKNLNLALEKERGWKTVEHTRRAPTDNEIHRGNRFLVRMSEHIKLNAAEAVVLRNFININ